MRCSGEGRAGRGKEGREGRRAAREGDAGKHRPAINVPTPLLFISQPLTNRLTSPAAHAAPARPTRPQEPRTQPCLSRPAPPRPLCTRRLLAVHT